MRDDHGPAPDDLPRSPSGRVPRWVVDEAHGQAPGDTRWRDAALLSTEAAGPGRGRRRRRRERRWPWVVAAVTVVAVATGLLVTRQAAMGSGYGRYPGWPPPGLEEGVRPRTAAAQPQPAPADGSARYLSTQPDSRLPVTWSPCRPIHYVVRTAGQTADGLGLLQSAIAEISRDTGLRFVYDGTTTESPSADREPYLPERYGQRWAPVLISWVTQAEDPDMTDQVLGLTRPYAVSQPDDGAGGQQVYVTGQVEMSTALIGAVQRSLGVKATRTVFLHELGHLVGLAHTTAPGAVMYPSYRPRVVTFTPSETAALASLGSGPCRPDV